MTELPSNLLSVLLSRGLCSQKGLITVPFSPVVPTSCPGNDSRLSLLDSKYLSRMSFVGFHTCRCLPLRSLMAREFFFQMLTLEKSTFRMWPHPCRHQSVTLPHRTQDLCHPQNPPSPSPNLSLELVSKCPTTPRLGVLSVGCPPARCPLLVSTHSAQWAESLKLESPTASLGRGGDAACSHS